MKKKVIGIAAGLILLAAAGGYAGVGHYYASHFFPKTAIRSSSSLSRFLHFSTFFSQSCKTNIPLYRVFMVFYYRVHYNSRGKTQRSFDGNGIS